MTKGSKDYGHIISEVKTLNVNISHILSVSKQFTFLHIQAPDKRQGAVDITHGKKQVWEGQRPESDKTEEASGEGPEPQGRQQLQGY